MQFVVAMPEGIYIEINNQWCEVLGVEYPTGRTLASGDDGEVWIKNALNRNILWTSKA